MTRKCELCQAEFNGQPSRVAKGWARFCSIKCWGANKAGGTTTAEERFWSHVTRTEGCWIWTGPVGTGGYGQLVALPIRTSAPRFSYELHFGPIPDGMCVCHRCDNRLCVKPGHFFLGTKGDNNRDATAKWRNVYGSRHPHAKINEETIPEILRLLNSGKLQREVAAQFGLQQPAISRIVHGVTWNRVMR